MFSKQYNFIGNCKINSSKNCSNVTEYFDENISGASFSKQYNYLDNSNSYEKYARYTSSDVIEHISMGNSSSSETVITNEQTSINQQEIESNVTTSQSNVTDASTTSTNNVNSTTQVDNSQETSNVNVTDNRSEQTLSSSQENINIDNSQVINETKQEISNQMQQSCGASISDVEGAINIVEDNSINTNIDASNTVVVTGNGNTMSNLTLDSEVQFSSPAVDRSCMLDLMNELDTQLDAINENSKEFKGGEGGDVGAKAGGNTTSNENTTEKKDEIDASLDASQTVENEQTVDAGQTTETDASTDVSNTTDQTTENEATSSASAGIGGAGAGLPNTFILVIVGLLAFMLMKESNVKISKELMMNGVILIAILYFLYMNSSDLCNMLTN